MRDRLRTPILIVAAGTAFAAAAYAAAISVDITPAPQVVLPASDDVGDEHAATDD